jgi:hypothetical protein
VPEYTLADDELARLLVKRGLAAEAPKGDQEDGGAELARLADLLQRAVQDLQRREDYLTEAEAMRLVGLSGRSAARRWKKFVHSLPAGLLKKTNLARAWGSASSRGDLYVRSSLESVLDALSECEPGGRPSKEPQQAASQSSAAPGVDLQTQRPRHRGGCLSGL